MLFHHLDIDVVVPCSGEIWVDDEGNLDRDDGPAFILRSGCCESEGEIIAQVWFKDSTVHRHDGPVIVARIPDSNQDHLVWMKDGAPHREDGPAQIIRYRPENVPIDLDSAIADSRRVSDCLSDAYNISSSRCRSGTRTLCEKWYENGDVPKNGVFMNSYNEESGELFHQEVFYDGVRQVNQIRDGQISYSHRFENSSPTP